MGERSSVKDPPGQSPVWWRRPVGVRVGTGGSGLGPWVRWVLRTGGRGAKRPRTSVIQPALHRGVWPLPRWRQRRALPAPPTPAPEASQGSTGGEGDLVGWGSGGLLWDMLMSVPWTLSSTRPGELWSSQRNKPLTSSDLCNLPSFQGETFRTCCVGSLWQDFWGLPEALCTWIFYKRSVFSI